MIPCAHLLTHPQPGCELELGYPAHCPRCTSYLPGLNREERTRCEVWTRVMGYHRPVGAFNPGKQSEHAERRLFREHADEPAGCAALSRPTPDREELVPC